MIEEIIKSVGTPTYVFDVHCLKARIKEIEDYFPKQILCYAMKANPFIVREIAEDIARFEVCSFGEYKILEDLKVDPSKIVLSGVWKKQSEIEYLFENNIEVGLFTVESKNQWKLLKELAQKYERPISILLRLTSGNQFGMTKEEIISIFKEESSWIHFRGIEYFSGTQKHNIKRIEKEMIEVSEFVSFLEKEESLSLEIEIGLGFPVYYFEGDEFEEDLFFKEVAKLLEHFKEHVVTLEIGRSLVASCGSYLTSVVDYKENKVGNFAILDGGIHHLVYYGSSMAMKIPHYEIFPKREGQNKNVNLCGSLCTINDILVKNVECPSLQIGDVVMFKNVGAYSMTEGISLFLSHDLPKVVFIKNKQIEVVRESIPTYVLNEPKIEGEK